MSESMRPFGPQSQDAFLADAYAPYPQDAYTADSYAAHPADAYHADTFSTPAQEPFLHNAAAKSKTAYKMAKINEEGYDLIGDEDASGQSLTPKKFWATVALAAAVTGTNIGSYFNGAVTLYMASDLGLTTFQTEWLQITSSLLFACTAPSVGYFSDIYGRRNALIMGMIANIVGLILSAAAPNFSTAIVALVFSGFGGAVVELAGTPAIAELVPVRKRGIFLALSAGLSLPFIPSILYVEIISTRATWRWCYGIGVIWNGVAFAAFLATYCRLKIVRPGQEARHAALKQVDYLGIFLLIAGSVLLIIGFEVGGSKTYAWTSAFVLGPLILGFLLLLVLIAWEWKGAKAPLIPFRLFQGQRVVALAYGIGFFGGLISESAETLGVMIIKEVFAVSPVQIGMYALAPSVSIFIGTIGFNVALSSFRKIGRELVVVAAVLMAGFGGALAASTPDTVPMFLAFSSLSTIGGSGLSGIIGTIVTIACPQDLIGTAYSLVAFLRTIGGVVGYAIFASIALGKGTQTVPHDIGEYAVKAGLPVTEVVKFVEVFYGKSAEVAAKLPSVTPAILKAASVGQQWGFNEAFRAMYYAQIPFGIIIVLLCIALPNISRYMTDKVVARAH